MVLQMGLEKSKEVMAKRIGMVFTSLLICKNWAWEDVSIRIDYLFEKAFEHN